MMEWNPAFYKHSYEGFEEHASFPDREALEDYRSLLLDKSRAQVEFIRRRIPDRKLRVLELCSGNGRLLVSLARDGLLDHGLGIEISQSRTAFAQAWARDLCLSRLQFVAHDALHLDEVAVGRFDLAICVTGAFNYFEAIHESAPGRLLAAITGVLVPNGDVLVELYRLSERRRQMFALADGRLRSWQPLPREDRFAFYLDDFTYWEQARILKHEKTFIGRAGQIDSGRIEVLKYYSLSEVEQMLQASGLAMVSICGDFDESAYDAYASEAQVVWARRTR